MHAFGSLGSRSPCLHQLRGLHSRAGVVAVYAEAGPPSSLRAQQQRWAKRQRFLPREPRVYSDDVLELNVGGKLMLTTRSTLLQVPGSRLHDMFVREGGAGLPRDAQGRPFLDVDPASFALVLHYLREHKMRAGRDSVSCMPAVRPEEAASFDLLLSYLRLRTPPPALSDPCTGFDNPALTATYSRATAAAAAAAAAAGSLTSSSSSSGGVVRPTASRQPCSGSAAASRGSSSSSSSSRSSPPAPCAALPPGCSPREVLGPVSAGRKVLLSAASALQRARRISALKDRSADALLRPPPRARQAAGTEGPAAAEGGAAAVRQVAVQPPTSQLFYIQSQYDAKRGIKVSVFTEADLRVMKVAQPCDVFCDATWADSQLSFTFVARTEFDDMFVGITSRSQLDNKGGQIPCYGWKRLGALYAPASPAGQSLAERDAQDAPSGGGAQDGAVAACRGGRFGDDGVWVEDEEPGGDAGAAAPTAPTEAIALWQKGDSVEVIVHKDLQQGAGHSRMVLKVNGRQVDVIPRLPVSFRSTWSWYLALHMAGDMSAVVLNRDLYSVYWSDFRVSRFLT